MSKTNVEGVRKARSKIVVRELKRIYPGDLETPLNYTTPFELLVAVILSAQTTDKKVNEVTPALFKKFPTPETFAKARLFDIQNMIRQIGFHRAKAAHIHKSAKIVVDSYGGQVPLSFEALIGLPGVGRKTAHVVLGHLSGEVNGIAVDTHVKRLSKKFGLTESSNPDIIERDLMEVLPRSEWWNTAYRIKAYGREISPARRGYDDPISMKLKAAGLL